MLAEFQARTQQRQKSPLSPSLREKKADILTPLATLEEDKPKPRKYRNNKVVIDGIEFDSRKEAQRWAVLKLMLAAGQISDLQRQVAFELAPAARLLGDSKMKPAIRFIADFTYLRDGEIVIEDTKSIATKNLPVYRIKKHLMKTVHGLDVHEV
jgi:ribosomal protein S8